MRQVLKFITLLAFLMLNIYHAKAIQEEQGSITEYWQKGPVYYVKIGDTISLLKDPQGYITAAIRLNMDTIKVVPDKSGKFYRTVSLDLKQSEEDLKQAIEVKVSKIIVK